MRRVKQMINPLQNGLSEPFMDSRLNIHMLNHNGNHVQKGILQTVFGNVAFHMMKSFDIVLVVLTILPE